ncbi:glycine betaine ABC transporter substrate-binding protein [Roseococcus thiosulfatophilus]|uniref:glycine betaine ABC transporter substrate-binding protein n=1 Tax=Roseococcus thiosulfatophilus TaxID=35813 RepID=UPI001A9069A4|nr:glycine betaine ABC transporter substrate-binding protein [Roseococcus thiosulfatophilus]
MAHFLGRRALAGLVLAAPAVASAQSRDRVVVSSKIDTEGALLGNLILAVLERAGVPAEARLSLGPTRIVRAALVAGEIDLYPEYTGNAAFFHNRADDPAWKNADQAHALARELDAPQGLAWLGRAPANNTWAIAVRRDVATRENLRTMEDLAAAAGRGVLRLAASAEFVESAAALPSFERTYGFTFPRDRIVVLPGGDTAVTMRSAAQQISGVNAAMVYGTDGAISALNLVVMTDTKGAQIVYEAAPVVRQAVLDRFPAMRAPLDAAFASLDLTTLQRLNAQIAVEGRPARDVARAHLEAAAR